MDWILIILIAALFYFLYRLDKRLTMVEEGRGLGISYSFSINARDAIHDHPMFLKKSKTKNIGDKGCVKVSYLASENGFVVTAYTGKSNFFFRGSATNCLFSQIIIGDENDVFGDKLTFDLDVRLEKDADGRYVDFFICYLEEHKRKSGIRGQLLFEFPLNIVGLGQDYYKGLGFEVIQKESEFLGEDSLGEISGVPASIGFRKNKTEIFLIN